MQTPQCWFGLKMPSYPGDNGVLKHLWKKHHKTASRPCSTDDLPTSIKEVHNNLRPPSDEVDPSDLRHDEERTTHQASQQQGGKQDLLARNKDRTSSETTTQEQRTAAQRTTRRLPSWTCDTNQEDQIDDGEHIIKVYNQALVGNSPVKLLFCVG